MKKCILLLITIIMLSACQSDQNTPAPAQENPTGKIALAIHGGAGNLKKLNLTPDEEKAYMHVLDSALNLGYQLLESGKTSTEAVEAVIQILEDSPLFNAGRGSVFTHEGTIEMDAAIMNGKDLSCGAVAGVKHIKNPISLARCIMDSSDFIFLHGAGAEEFAFAHGFTPTDTSYFFTEKRWNQLQEALKDDKVGLDHDKGKETKETSSGDKKFGTVGCVALDMYGNLAAGTSTGGLVNKRYSRIGDSPVIGAGTYANNATCAVSCTGKGEDFIRLNVASEISALMRYRELNLDSAVHEVIWNRLKAIKGRGGCIAVDRNGNVAMDFTTTGMFRAFIDGQKKREVAIYKNGSANEEP